MADIGLVFDSGVRTLELSDGAGHSVEVRFNPYDIYFLGAVMNAAEKLDEEQGKLRQIRTDDWRDVYHAALEADERMKTIIDQIFGVPVCATLFPDQTVHAIGGGLPVWANLLYAIVDKMDVGLGAEKEQARKRIAKYSAKYKK